MHGLRKVSAFPADEIEGVIDSVKDRAPIPPAICGGLVHPGDERVLSYYSRETEPLNCKLHYYCEGFDSFGDCVGKGCRVVHRKGLPESTQEFNCESAPCDLHTAEPITPHKACSEKSESSKLRIYECEGASAKCFSVSDSVFNCVAYYNATPIDKAGEPAGWSALAKQPEFPPRSSAASSEKDAKHPFDSSMKALNLDDAALQFNHAAVHPVIPNPYNLEYSMPIENAINRLMQPPEVKLILPSGMLGLQKTRSSLFSRIFSSLIKAKHEPEPVEEVINNDPDILLLASKYLREIPLMEVEYVPVEVAVPTVSRMEVKQRREEWNAWLEGARLLEETTGVEIGQKLEDRIKENDEVMNSYVALQDTVRRARLHEPTYIHALLSYVEEANEFYYNWIDKNAETLEGWHDTYSMYLPELRSRVRSLYQVAARVTKECLVPACRMNVVPVKPDTMPWDLFPDGIGDIFTGDMSEYRTWLPEGPPLWAGYHGSRVQWHPFEILGTPLPDLTLDLSQIAFGKKVTVPVLDIQKYHIDLQSPPALDPTSFAGDVEGLKKNLKELKRFHPPLFEFPDIDLPDPEGSLFFVPPPPVENLLTWNTLLSAREQMLSQLDPDNDSSLCNPSDSATTFLMSEPDLVSSARDPASVRAVSLVPGAWEGSSFTVPTENWKDAQLYLPNGQFAVSLAWSPVCPWCSSQRPQRIIKQRAELEVSWGALQETLLKAIDTWNAQVRFHSIVDRNELVKEEVGHEPHSGLDEDLSKKFR